MRRYVLSSLIALAVVSLVSAPVFAQAPVAANPPPAAKAWTMPRTPDGKPDLQGVYSNATAVPVARPANLGAKEFYDSEADKAASASAPTGGRGGAARPANDPGVHYDNGQFGLNASTAKRVASLR